MHSKAFRNLDWNALKRPLKLLRLNIKVAFFGLCSDELVIQRKTIFELRLSLCKLNEELKIFVVYMSATLSSFLFIFYAGLFALFNSSFLTENSFWG